MEREIDYPVWRRIERTSPRIRPNAYTIDGDVARLVLTDRDGKQAGVALIDRDDLERVITYARWSPRKEKKHGPYAKAKRDKISVELHRFILRSSPTERTIFLNGNSLDCRKCNLQSVANANAGARNVWWDIRTKKWRVEIQRDKSRHRFGYFDSIDEAREAAAAARRAINVR